MAQSFALVLLAVIALGSGCCYGWILSGWWTPCFNNPPIDLGCFPLSYPFNNSAGFYPQSPESMNIQFHVYSRRHNITVTLGDVQQNLLNNYNVSRNTVLIIHGYLEGQDEIWIKDLIRELLIKNDVNIITVDWYQGANSFFYYQSVANARVVGAVLALFVQELISLGSQPSSFHLVGFSLGAHVAGFAGSRLGGIGRITGLDPAGPSFEDAPPEVRLDPSDALFVDVIHTDSTLGIGMGTLVPMGTVDFYVNGGEDQPSCANSVIGRLSAFFNTLGSGFDSMRTALGCSHMRATQLFMQSVNHVCGWPTYLCPDQDSLQQDQCTPCDTGQCHGMGYNLVYQSVLHSSVCYRTNTPELFPFCCTLDVRQRLGCQPTGHLPKCPYDQLDPEEFCSLVYKLIL